MFGSHFFKKKNSKFKIQKIIVWETISIFEISFFKNYLQKVIWRICRLLFFYFLFFMDNDNGIEIIMYFFLMISFKFEV